VIFSEDLRWIKHGWIEVRWWVQVWPPAVFKAFLRVNFF
jgi:hypothetical protein